MKLKTRLEFSSEIHQEKKDTISLWTSLTVALKFQTENQPWFIRNFSWFHTIVTYVIRSSFQQLFLKFQTENKAWHQKFFINMIPYHCDICDTKFVSTASFEIQKKETRLIPWSMTAITGPWFFLTKYLSEQH